MYTIVKWGQKNPTRTIAWKPFADFQIIKQYLTTIVDTQQIYQISPVELDPILANFIQCVHKKDSYET